MHDNATMLRRTVALRFPTLLEVQDRIGHVPVERILNVPPPGTATWKDCHRLNESGGRNVELIDGILVEKAMGAWEGNLAAELTITLGIFLREHNVGTLFDGATEVRFKPLLVRKPDVSFVAWDSMDDPELVLSRAKPVLEIPPDLAIEVFSKSNTPQEMAIKLGDYENAGVKLVWYVDPATKTVAVYRKAKASTKLVLGMDGVLDGGKVLPGFKLPVKDIFARRAPKKTKRKG
jgi:Uma2 family endonuclease